MRWLAPAVALAIFGCGSPAQRSVESVAAEVAGKGTPACTRQPESIISEGLVGVVVGEVACVRLSADGNALSPESLASVPLGTVVVATWLEGSQTYLRIENPFGRPLRYMAVIQPKGTATQEYTSTCTVLPGLFSLEHWPYEIDFMYLGRFELGAETDEVKCF